MAVVKCPKCGTKYDLEEHGKYQCLKCKRSFYFPLNMTICPYCQSEVPASSPKCRYCGEWIDKNHGKSRSTYLLLTFLFGNLGAGEFYAGRTVAGFVYLFISCSALYFSSFNPSSCVLIWIVACIGAFFSDFCLPPEKAQKRKTIGTVCAVLVAVSAVIFALFVMIKYWPNK